MFCKDFPHKNNLFIFEQNFAHIITIYYIFLFKNYYHTFNFCKVSHSASEFPKRFVLVRVPHHSTVSFEAIQHAPHRTLTPLCGILGYMYLRPEISEQDFIKKSNRFIIHKSLLVFCLKKFSQSFSSCFHSWLVIKR
jgi:hypothetical protein